MVHNALERTCRANGVPFRPEDAIRVYEEVPSWGPHPDVPAGLAKVAQEIPLVILSNAMKSQIMSNVDKLGAPFHMVITAEETGAYKPQMRGFEYMLDKLGCRPEDICHVSSSFRYDLMTAHDLGITQKVWVNRGHEPANPITATPRSGISAGCRGSSGCEAGSLLAGQRHALCRGGHRAVAGDYDVAVIGAGFTGLGAARRLAMEGKSVVVLEALRVGAGASGAMAGI